MNLFARVSASMLLLSGVMVSTKAAAQPAAAPPAAVPSAAAAEPPPPPPPAPPLAVPSPAAPAAMDMPPPVTPAPEPVVSSVKIESPSTTIKFGILAQPQYEAFSVVTAPTGYTQNLFLRRARILAGGTLFGMFDYFIDTDFPNLFKAATVGADAATGAPGTSVKAAPGMNIQDVFVTYKPMADLFKVDVGYMLPPLAHNAVQGAGTLFGLDYFTYSFQHSNSFGASLPPVGRDAGVQLRGLVLDGHLEYRAGLFQGLRNAPTATEVGSRNFFRAAARVQVNLFDAEPGFFYAGTYFGAKKILSIGASGDVQDSYRYVAGDVLADLQVGPGVFTGQANIAHWNGHAFIPALVSQTAIMVEAGYTIKSIISPIVRFEQLVLTGTAPNDTRISGGVAFWPYKHASNLKVFYTRIMREAAPKDANQINVQWQLYFF